MSKNHHLRTLLAWLVAVFVLPLPFLYTFVQGLPAGMEGQKLAIANGIIAYVWMLLAIYIGTKPKWLDRLIGLPVAYMIHGILSMVAIFLAMLHKSASPSYGLIALTGNIAFNIFLALLLYSLIFMAGWLTSRVPFLATIKKKLETTFKHEVSLALHRLNLLATFLIFVHIQLIDYIRSNVPFMLVVYLATFFVFFSYLRSKLGKTAQGVQAQLVSNRQLADNIHEFRIQLPAKHDLTLRAGDFVFISFPDIKGLEEPHPFSLVNNPKNSCDIVLAIRGDGDFTRQLQELEAPAQLMVNGGYGLYQTIIDEQAPKEILAISGGIGITPILSIVEANPNIKTTVFHGASTKEALLYEEKFLEWSKRPNFVAHRLVGRFEEEEVLASLPKELNSVTVLISGPAAMARYWMACLEAYGVPKGQIFYEEFGW
ncbi:FAD-binding oxidoreductase [Streptococcus cuniculipharyngis]|uniref:Iron reductase n=1 Tax=Streptococcus cuniculipharyngis TaxID=1562651 RepID=A0A5C5SFJ0_9STRE|nr:FAD-binding oxidoreductase [Streptococcus cuniculipharyngis]TWS98721.1 iron reductase [Streptococcus cuniculipharyngis]